jgi:hypothetical protein
LPGKIKSGDLFIGKTRKQMGLNGWLRSVEVWKCLCPGFQTMDSFKQSLYVAHMTIWLCICLMLWMLGMVTSRVYATYMYTGTFFGPIKCCVY